MGVKPETIDCLLLSRSLIAPLRFKPAKDRFAIAHHVLAAHDAAELAIASICAECGVSISDSRSPGLPEYLGKLKEHLHPAKEVHAKDYINKLNRVRVDLKHHGITPDPQQWDAAAERVFGHISTWCTTYLQTDYAELDATAMIRSSRVRSTMSEARAHLRNGKYKECLEKLAVSISDACFGLFPTGIHVSSGDDDAETALALSAYGVDPGRFIALQRLLPKYFWMYKSGPIWEPRKYGHEANWTPTNLEFAYSETVNLLTRLQEASPYPTPYLYTNVFKDVLVVKKDNPKVTVLQWSYFDNWQEASEQPRFSIGDRIECHAVGSMVAPPEIPDLERSTRDPEDCVQVIAKDIQQCDKLKDAGPFPAVVFQREDVEITKERWWRDEEAENAENAGNA